MKIQRGKKIGEILKSGGQMHDALKVHFKDRNSSKNTREKCYRVIERMKNLRSWASEYMKDEPQTANPRYYGKKEYEWDKRNVRFYYIKWTRQDIFNSKASLARIRKFEKRNGLEPFNEIEAKEKENLKLKKISNIG